ncbi:MAG: ClpXP protease specificity-enhancing factor SspB [Pseudomonadota bacterium]
MSEDHIRYDILTQEALRGVVRKVLQEVVQTGLPGEHHFFISFDTRFPGVRLSPRMLEQYPEEMTIVLQHQFWDLKVSENGFEVGLSFSDIPERLIVPYAAIKGFFDPCVQFGLEFDVEREGIEPVDDEDDAVDEATVHPLRSNQPASQPVGLPEPDRSDTAADADESADAEGSEGGADVVSLDAFRKKP